MTIDSRLGDIPLRTYAPPRGTRSVGAVYLWHGLRSEKRSLDTQARRIAHAGVTTILVDAPHHGARHSPVLGTMPNALSLEGHYVLLRLLREARDEVPRLVDHAHELGHPKVALAGVSFGAFIALAAASVEPRVAAIASVLGSPDWTPRDGFVPEDLAAAVAESPHLRPEAFVPRPLLLLNGALDENVRPAGARALVEKLRPLYRERGVGGLLHHEYPQTTHFPSPAVWDDIWSTVARFLGRALA